MSTDNRNKNQSKSKVPGWNLPDKRTWLYDFLSRMQQPNSSFSYPFKTLSTLAIPSKKRRLLSVKQLKALTAELSACMERQEWREQKRFIRLLQVLGKRFGYTFMIYSHKNESGFTVLFTKPNAYGNWRVDGPLETKKHPEKSVPREGTDHLLTPKTNNQNGKSKNGL